jgi:histidine triad (HIT) family protein
MSHECVFCSIIEGHIPASIIVETKDIIVLEDRAPKAPIHYLIIPKKHLENLNYFKDEDRNLAGDMLLMAKELGKRLQEPKAFRLIFNNEFEAGQRVFHCHAHFLAGKELSEF